jgi:dihydroxyacetone kinase-like protein
MGCAGAHGRDALGNVNMAISCGAVVDWIKNYTSAIAGHHEYLTQLDAAIGDADHGINMNRGFQAVLAKLPAAAGEDTGAVFKCVGMTLISTVGGASGPLYGTLFLQMAAVTAGKPELTLADWTNALISAAEGIARRGKAVPGDKTMLDTLLPGVEALKTAAASGASLPDALRQAAKAAEKGMLSTIPMTARKGRASYLGERSAGHQDPGATSAYLLFKTAVDTFST